MKNCIILDDVKLSLVEDHISDHIRDHNNFYELTLLEKWSRYIQYKNIVFDVGAHIGNHSIYFSNILKCKEIYSFEPNKLTFDILAKNIADNNIKNIKLFNYGISDGCHFATIKPLSTGREVASLELSRFETDIKLISIDDFVTKKNVIPNFIKIDVDGFEYYVLNGSIKTLTECRALLWVELRSSTVMQCLDLLFEIGYKIIDVEAQNFLLSMDEELIAQARVPYDQFMKNVEDKWSYRNWMLESKNNLLDFQIKFNAEQNKVKQLTDQISEYEDGQKAFDKMAQELKILKSTKSYRIQVKYCRYRNILKVFGTQVLVRTINFVNRKTQKKIKLRRFLIGINSRLNLIKDKRYYYNVAQNYNTGLVKKDNGIKPIKKIKVAVILDEFSYKSFKDVFEGIVINPDNWLQKFTDETPDLLLCESAWSGVDSELRPWKGKIYSSVNFNKENRFALLKILKFCHNNKIPSIFWNKEDPTYYEDKIHNFIDTAIKFDHIFTTAEEVIDLYKTQHGHKSVHLLMFATNPKLFNPIKKYARTNDLVFAGSWYQYFEKRCSDITLILDRAIENNINIKIYDRYFNASDTNHKWPDKYQKYVLPVLSYDEVDKAYKSSNYALNFTSVTHSQTMFARRVFELMSCRTTIISNYSVGIEKLLGDNVVFANERMELNSNEQKLDDNLYLALSKHTYKHRFKQILDTIKYPYVDEREDISILFLIHDERDIRRCIKSYDNIEYKKKKYVLVISQSIDNTHIKNIFQKYNTIEGTVISLDYILKYDNEFSISTQYFILMDIDNLIPKDFIEKALLHFSYISDNVGIKFIENRDDKYTFGEDCQHYNIIYNSAMLHRVLTQTQEKIYFI